MAAPSTPASSSSADSLANCEDSSLLFNPPTRQSTGLTSAPGEDDTTDPDAIYDTHSFSESAQEIGPSTTVTLAATGLTKAECDREIRGEPFVDPGRLVFNRRLLLANEPEVAGPDKSKAGIIGSLKKALGRQEKYTEHRRVFFPTLSITQTKGRSAYGRHRYRYGQAYSFTVLQSMHADKDSPFSTYLSIQASRGQRDTRLRVVLRIYEAVVPQPSEDPRIPVDSTGISIARRERRVYARLGGLKHVAKQHLLDAFGCLKSGNYFVFVTPAQHCTLHEVLSGKVKLEIRSDPTLLPRAWVAQLTIGLDVLHQQGVIHRSLSPKSILVTHEGQLKIGDYHNAFVDDKWTPLIAGQRCRERHGQADISGAMDADETNHNDRYYGYGKEVDVWSLGCVAGEILRDSYEAHKILFGKDTRFRSYVNGNRNVQFGLLERFVQTNNHFRVGFVYQMLHVDPQRRISLDRIPAHPFFDFWLKEKPRFPNGRRIKNFFDLASYKPFSVEEVPLVKGFNLEHEPLGENQAYITAWAQEPKDGRTPTLDSLDNYTWVNPAQPMN